MIASLSIFVIIYALIASEKVDKTVIVMIGACLMVSLGLISFDRAVEAIDLNVIFLLVGMMTCVHVLSHTGFFEFLAVKIAQAARGIPLLIMMFFLVLTAVLSAFLDNVTTVILLAPVTILIAQLLDISPLPFLILEAIASNIGGTATLIGDPPNIIIGSQAGLTFNEFLLNLGGIIVIVMVVFLSTIFLIYRKHWQVEESAKKKIMEAIPRLAIIDAANMTKALIVLGVVFIGFFTHHITHIQPGVVALLGSMVMMLLCKSNIDKTLMRVEWGVIFFFIGFFMIVAGLEYTGVVDLLAQGIIALGGNNLFLLCVIILCFSAIFSAFMDNIPFVITMVPIIKKLIIQLSAVQMAGGGDLIAGGQPLWWALALGACLGGNGTLVGASANIIISKIGEKNNCPITFGQFFKFGFPFMVQTVIISLLCLWFKYFRGI